MSKFNALLKASFGMMSFQKLLAVSLLVGSSAVLPQAAQAQTQIYGSGASFPAALYRQWFNQYGVAIDTVNYPVIPCGSFGNTDFSIPVPPLPCANPIDPAVQFFYASVGSGAGRTNFINNLRTGTVATNPDPGIPLTSYPRIDFAGTDGAVSQSEYNTYLSLQKPTRGALLEVPFTSGPVTLAFSNNIPGATLPTIANPNCTNNPTAPCAVPTIPNLKLTRKAYCGIFTGTITNWNNPEITKYNTALKTVNATINVVRRSDSSGTTTIFTTHLREVCDGLNGVSQWIGGVGGTVTWPAQANFRSANTNSGMATEVLNPAFPGSIGYITADFTSIAPTPALSPAPFTTALENEASFAARLITPTLAPKFYAASAKQTKLGIPTAALPTGGGSSNTLAGQTFRNTPASPAIVDGASVPCASCITQSLPNPTATAAYPILGFSYVLFYQKYPAFDIGGVAIPTAIPSKLINFTTKFSELSPVTAKTGTTTDADDIATLQGFVPLSPAIKTQVRNLVSTGTFKITN